MPQPSVLSDDPRVFRKVLLRAGDFGVHTYRIPGLTTTPRGTLICVFDMRNKGAGDLPADIDVGMMRSTDNGLTWSRPQRILTFDKGDPKDLGNGVGDPCVLVDRQTGRIFVAGMWTHGNRGIRGSGPGVTPDLSDQLVLTESGDDGLTWSRPRSITPTVKDPAWDLLFQGPGRGIQIHDGTLVLPAQFIAADRVFHSALIYSPDHGVTWKITPAAIPGTAPTSESQVAQLADGSLLLTMRNEAHAGVRAWARWEWSGSLANGRWSAPFYVVDDPTCMASLISVGERLLLLSNPNSRRSRVALTVRASVDGGRTWPDSRLLDPRPCAYSCMTTLNDGSIGIVYETGDRSPYDTLTFARFPLDWVRDREIPRQSVDSPAEDSKIAPGR